MSCYINNNKKSIWMENIGMNLNSNCVMCILIYTLWWQNPVTLFVYSYLAISFIVHCGDLKSGISFIALQLQIFNTLYLPYWLLCWHLSSFFTLLEIIIPEHSFLNFLAFCCHGHTIQLICLHLKLFCDQITYYTIKCMSLILYITLLYYYGNACTDHWVKPLNIEAVTLIITILA